MAREYLPEAIAHWPLRETTGTTIVDLVGGYNGVCTVDASTLTTAGATARLGTALNFGGSEYVTVPDNNVFSFTDGADNDTAYSIAAWIYCVQAPIGASIVSKYDNAAEREWYFKLNLNTEALQCLMYDNTTAGYIGWTGDSVPEGGWYHVMMTYDASETAAGIKLYLDNSLMGGGAIIGGAYAGMERKSADLVIGAMADVSNFYPNALQDIRIWSKVLSTDNRGVLYNNGLGQTGGLGSIISPFPATNLS